MTWICSLSNYTMWAFDSSFDSIDDLVVGGEGGGGEKKKNETGEKNFSGQSLKRK